MEVSQIVESQRNFFATGVTRDVNFRREQLLKLREALQHYESQLLDALWRDLHKSEREAFLTEMSIVYGNRYRSYYDEVDKGLADAEVQFYKGNYKDALDISIKSTALVDEEIYKKLLRIYDK